MTVWHFIDIIPATLLQFQCLDICRICHRQWKWSFDCILTYQLHELKLIWMSFQVHQESLTEIYQQVCIIFICNTQCDVIQYFTYSTCCVMFCTPFVLQYNIWLLLAFCWLESRFASVLIISDVQKTPVVPTWIWIKAAENVEILITHFS